MACWGTFSASFENKFVSSLTTVNRHGIDNDEREFMHSWCNGNNSLRSWCFCVTSVQCVRRLLALPCIALVSKTASYAGYGNEIVKNCPLYEQNNNLARCITLFGKNNYLSRASHTFGSFLCRHYCTTTTWSVLILAYATFKNKNLNTCGQVFLFFFKN